MWFDTDNIMVLLYTAFDLMKYNYYTHLNTCKFSYFKSVQSADQLSFFILVLIVLNNLISAEELYLQAMVPQRRSHVQNRNQRFLYN